jgi:hypothetical protein
MESYPKPSHSNKQGKTITASPISPIHRLPQRTIAVTHPNLYSALKKWQKVNMPQSHSQQSTKASIQSKTSNSVPSTLHIIETPTSTMTQKRNELWGSSLLQLPTTIGKTDLNPPSQELQDQRSKAVNDRAEAVELIREEEKNNDIQREKIKRLTVELEEEQKALTFMEAETGSALAKATSTTIIDELDQEIAKQKRQPSITKIKLWQHRKHGKTFVTGMNELFNFQDWNTNDDQETKVVAGSQDSYRNLGQQTAAILYVYYDISNWFSEDELCTLLGYAIRNHNVKQAIFRMVERNMLICKRDTTGTEKYYLSKLPLEISGRSPEDNPDIERTNPTYANSIEIRKKAGLTLINSRKHLKASPSQAATITPLTLAEGVAEAQKADAKRELNFTNPPQQHSNKRSKTTASITRTAPTGFIANTSDSLESVEEPPTKPIDLSQSSSSDSSDSEDSDSDDTPTKNNNTGFMEEDVFDQVIPAARNKGTDFNNVRDV